MVSLGMTLVLAGLVMALGSPVRAAIVSLQPWRSAGADSETELPLLQPTWRYLRSDWGRVVGHAAFPGIISLAFYVIYCLPYFALDVLDLAATREFRHRGVSRPSSDSSQWAHCVKHTLWMAACFILPGVLWQLATRGPWLYHNVPQDPCLLWCDGRVLFPATAPSLTEFALHTLSCLVVFDAVYYTWHRAHHLCRPLYRHIHAVHHEYHAPFIWVTMYEHPAELFHVSALSLIVPIALGAHPLTQWAWLMVSVALSVDAHAGYDLPFHKLLLILLPFSERWIPGGLGGSVHHDLHHQFPPCNFEPFLTWLDIFGGTSYEQSMFKKKKKKEKDKTG